MPHTRSVDVKDGDVLVLVGTTKGAFVLRSRAARARWDVGGPHFPGQQIYAMTLDGRGGSRRLIAGGVSDHWGPVLHASEDFGATWSNPERAPIRFPEDTGATLKRVWQVVPGAQPGVLYAGVEPAALFVSRDSGESWELVRGLWDHPHREMWQPGGGGLCLHTILPDPANPDRITIAISTGGVYRSEDGGATWSACNQGVRAEFMPDKYPEFGQCVHKVVHHPSNPRRLFLQNHWGLYRSDDAGDSWQDIANGVPSDFGFAMAMHPHDPDTVYIVPIESDAFRCTPDGKLRVYRTRDGGASWEPLSRGLPQQNALECILRDAMDTDELNPAGVYFGTRSGSVYGSADGGASWSELVSGLPPVVCVKAAYVGDPSRARVPSTSARAAKRPKPRVKAAARPKPRMKSAARPKSRAKAAARPKPRVKAASKPRARAARAKTARRAAASRPATATRAGARRRAARARGPKSRSRSKR